MFIVHAAAPGHHWSWEFFRSGQEAVERAERLVRDGEARRADVYAAERAKTADAAQACVELGVAEHVVSKGGKAQTSANQPVPPLEDKGAEALIGALLTGRGLARREVAAEVE
jgi:hypothetical protein